MRTRAFAGVLAVAAAVVVGPGIGSPGSATSSSASPDETASDPSDWGSKVLVGHSVLGRPIDAIRQGNPNAPIKLLVTGEMHGDEPAGMWVVDRLRRAAIDPDGPVQIWTIRTINPDGSARRTRDNAHRVDLNRNFPNRWRRQGQGTPFYSGPRAASEPETRAVMAFIRQLEPTAVISFHQPLNTVHTVCSPRNRSWVLAVGRRLGLPVDVPRSCAAFDQRYRGTMNDWTTADTGARFATAELPGSRSVSARRVKRTVAGILALAVDLRRMRL